MGEDGGVRTIQYASPWTDVPGEADDGTHPLGRFAATFYHTTRRGAMSVHTPTIHREISGGWLDTYSDLAFPYLFMRDGRIATERPTGSSHEVELRAYRDPYAEVNRDGGINRRGVMIPPGSADLGDIISHDVCLPPRPRLSGSRAVRGVVRLGRGPVGGLTESRKAP